MKAFEEWWKKTPRYPRHFQQTIAEEAWEGALKWVLTLQFEDCDGYMMIAPEDIEQELGEQ